MPRFYTDITVENECVRDAEGEWFEDIEDARESASRSGRRLISEAIDAGRDAVKLEYRIRDDEERHLRTVIASAIFSVMCSEASDRTMTPKGG